MSQPTQEELAAQLEELLEQQDQLVFADDRGLAWKPREIREPWLAELQEMQSQIDAVCSQLLDTATPEFLQNTRTVSKMPQMDNNQIKPQGITLQKFLDGRR